MPARGPIQSAPGRLRASCLTGTTTGPGGAFPGLGQAGAGNARGRARGLRPPVGATVQDRTSCRVPGNLAWSCAERARAPTVRAAVERRQASASFGCAPHRKMRRLETRLSAFRLLLFAGSESEFAGSEPKRSSECPQNSNRTARFALLRCGEQKLGCRCAARTIFLYLSPRAGRGRSERSERG